MKIVPVSIPGDNKQNRITNTSIEEITKILGFPPNVSDDPEKVTASWGFEADGIRCGIWDYYKSYKEGVFSTFGPRYVFVELFGENRVS